MPRILAKDNRLDKTVIGKRIAERHCNRPWYIGAGAFALLWIEGNSKHAITDRPSRETLLRHARLNDNKTSKFSVLLWKEFLQLFFQPKISKSCVLPEAACKRRSNFMHQQCWFNTLLSIKTFDAPISGNHSKLPNNWARSKNGLLHLTGPLESVEFKLVQSIRLSLS